MSNLEQAARLALDALKNAQKVRAGEGGTKHQTPLENAAITVLEDALAQQQAEPVAWRTFDGEGGYDYRTHDDNENYAQEWAQRNWNHKGWVEPLYTTPQQAEPVHTLVSDAEYLRLFEEARNGSDRASGVLRGIRAVIAAYEAATPKQAEPVVVQAEPVEMQYIALCDAMRYSERKNESFSPEEHAESLVAEIDRLRGIVPEVLEQLNDELCEENKELLEALKLARSICNILIGHPENKHGKLIDAAIKKAEGKE
jgi:hypothetical protein